jgi:hypothetical protein
LLFGLFPSDADGEAPSRQASKNIIFLAADESFRIPSISVIDIPVLSMSSASTLVGAR